ncbi:MAG: hypothetical protein K2J11_09180, partial [Oscillospiraceae bacterium]|nr:hypothetical protein [Oscillospiraceae bacterium]
EKELFCGAGMGAKDVFVIEKNVSESVWAEFSAKQQEGCVSEFRLENKAALCEKCREIFSAAVFFYKLSDGDSAEYIAPCPECGGTVRILDDTENTACPKCGGKMTAAPVGHWD